MEGISRTTPNNSTFSAADGPRTGREVPQTVKSNQFTVDRLTKMGRYGLMDFPLRRRHSEAASVDLVIVAGLWKR